MTDSTSTVYYKVECDKTFRVVETMELWKKMRYKGSMVVYFDGSGRVVRFTLTSEGR